ncbi:putative iron-dependent peroxidase [Formivibrio citricus]|uniref:Putative iron-dependent peroxidase n=1 Tax=Formivibrio citricus TaxID=83765 RepID=A0A1I4VUE2_9NEIS|nr:Dyp-type peroxidase [Formivibrio citricus]SFN04616.1 putative iron-dependent peroxidase [Formivibrio citricus]
MPTPQNGILPDASQHALFLLFRRRIGRRASPKLKAMMAQLPERVEKMLAECPASRLGTVIAFGSAVWAELWSDRPQALHPFPRIPGAVHPVPITEADVFLHLRADHYDVLHDLADQLTQEFAEWLDLLEVVHGFRYRDGRDLLGFMDGDGAIAADARPEIALVGKEDPAWVGGSYIHVQRYVHRMEEWNKLPLKQQETVMGRTKQGNVEFSREDRALTSHQHRVSIEQDGKPLEILRRSMPYGIPGGERGMYFCSYCRTPQIYEKMLARMVAPTIDGRVDHLLNFTRAVTGAAFFAPSVENLKRLAA